MSYLLLVLAAARMFFQPLQEIELRSKINQSVDQKTPSTDRRDSPAIVQPPREPQLLSVASVDRDRSDAWDRYFAERFVHPPDVQYTARYLINRRQFGEAVEVIQAALRHGQIQPWMYEGLALTMLADNVPRSEIERALMSVVDITTSMDEVISVARVLSETGFDRRALQIYQDVAQGHPNRHEPWVEGMKIAQRLDDLSAIQWACVGVLKQSWTTPTQEQVYAEALKVAESTLIQLERVGQLEAARQFSNRIRNALQRDCVVTVTWTGQADVDLIVEEPAGTICSRRNPRTSGGGVLQGDRFSHEGRSSLQGVSEQYVCPVGFPGLYRVMIKPIWGKVTSGKVTVEVYRNYRSDQQTVQRQQIDLEDGGALVLFRLENARRSQPLAQHQVVVATQQQLDFNRTVQQIAYQIRRFEHSRASRQLMIDTASSSAVRHGSRRRGPVGFRPVIQRFPEGANLTTNAVVSADRRYVRMSPRPFFSQISSVSTFNFVTGANGDGNGDGDGNDNN